MLTLALAVLLTFTDPPADLGDGTVRQPTAAVGRPNGALDVTQFDLYDSEAVTFSLTFTSLANPFNLPNGFTFPIIEVYLDDQSGTGSPILLPGSGMRLPQSSTWNYAFKLTGETLQVFQANPNGWQDVTQRYPTRITVQGTTIVVSSSVPRPEQFDLYGMVGSYTGFNETGWAPMSRSESPWAYSSEQQIPAALDVIAPTFEAQQDALASGVLPVIRPPRPTNPWIFVMIGGVLVAVLGVMLRFAPSRNRTLTPSYSPAPPVPVPTEPDTKPKSAHPGPYQAEPLKSRSAALKDRVGDPPETVVSEETNPPAENHLTPGQLMAAERTKAMILNDRKLRDTGETLAAKADLTEPIHLDSAALENDIEPADLLTKETALEQPSSSTVVSSTAIPLFEKPKRVEDPKTPASASAQLPSAPVIMPNKPVPTNLKAQFAPSEVWHDEEDELAFLWNDSEDVPEVKKPLPKKSAPENNS